MKTSFSVSVVIPAYNEADNLPCFVYECVETLSKLTSEYEIVVVDDASTDSTQKVLIELQSSYPSLKVIRNKFNLGCHPSSLVGLKAACGEVLIFLPADRQIPPSNILNFLAGINDYDLVCSYRRERADTVPRKLASRLYNVLLRLFFGVNLHDTHSAIAVKKEVVKTVASDVKSNCAFAGCEFILRVLACGFHVSEIEVDHLPRTSGKAKGANLKDAIWTPLDLLQFFLRTRLLSFLRGI